MQLFRFLKNKLTITRANVVVWCHICHDKINTRLLINVMIIYVTILKKRRIIMIYKSLITYDPNLKDLYTDEYGDIYTKVNDRYVLKYTSETLSYNFSYKSTRLRCKKCRLLNIVFNGVDKKSNVRYKFLEPNNTHYTNIVLWGNLEPYPIPQQVRDLQASIEEIESFINTLEDDIVEREYRIKVLKRRLHNESTR